MFAPCLIIHPLTGEDGKVVFHCSGRGFRDEEETVRCLRCHFIGLRNTFDQTLLLPLVTSNLLIVYIKLYNSYPYDSNAVLSLL